jgi:hypothetical protein
MDLKRLQEVRQGLVNDYNAMQGAIQLIDQLIQEEQIAQKGQDATRVGEVKQEA